MRTTIVAALLALGSHSDAQSWSITAHAPVVGTATASRLSPPYPPSVISATLPVGPVSAGTFLTSSIGLATTTSASVNMTWQPTVTGGMAPLQFTTSSSCGCHDFSMFDAMSASGYAEIVLTLRAPQPVGGRLLVSVSGSDTATSGSTASSRIDLDVNADGTIEVSAQAGAASTPLDVPLQIPATGALIRLAFNSQASTPMGPTGDANGTRTISAAFFPGDPAIAPFATFNGASTMSVNHLLPGSVTLSIAGPGLTPVLMAFGGTPISVPWLPYVTVLVSPDVLIGTTGSITLQLPPLPPGALYAQGLLVDSAGTLRGTNSVRFLWL